MNNSRQTYTSRQGSLSQEGNKHIFDTTLNMWSHMTAFMQNWGTWSLQNSTACHVTLVPLGQQTNMNREKVLDINLYHFLPTLVWESWFDTHCHFCHRQWIIQCHRFLRRKPGKKIYLDQTLQGRINQGPGLLWGRWLGSATPWRKSISMEITTLIPM